MDPSGQGWKVKSFLSLRSAIHGSWWALEGTAERDSDQDKGAGQMRCSLRLLTDLEPEADRLPGLGKVGCGRGGGWGEAGPAQEPKQPCRLASAAQHLGPGDENPWLALRKWSVPAGCPDSHREGTPEAPPTSESCRATGRLTQKALRCPLLCQEPWHTSAPPPPLCQSRPSSCLRSPRPPHWPAHLGAPCRKHSSPSATWPSCRKHHPSAPHSKPPQVPC